MTNNPYNQAPVSSTRQNPHPKQTIFPPGVALLIVSAFSITCFAIALAFNVFLLVSGAADNLPDVEAIGIAAETQIAIRMCLGTLLLLVHSFIAYGAYNMMQQKSFSIAKTASIIAVIPCLSPCYFLGIPFGIWALVALGKPGVQRSFES